MHIVSGIVLEGKRRGSALGYPTANIACSDGTISGIYAATVVHDGKEHMAAVFSDPSRGILEAHLLDFFGDLYGHEIRVHIKKKIRDTEAFQTDEALKAAIAEDVNAVRQCLSV